MSVLIALTGKGGVGKTTVSALLTRRLVDRGLTPVLAIDADPNSCLDAALGLTVSGTVGQAREDVRRDAQDSPGVSKTELLQMKIAESLAESEGFDLIAMGRPEGAGCYCYANNVLKSVITELAGSYPFVVLDNEAGLENLSRRIVRAVDVLALVSDASNAGLRTLRRLYDLAHEMEIQYGKLVLILNRLRHEADAERFEELRVYTNADAVIPLPDDALIAELAENAEPLTGVPEGHSVWGKMDELIDLVV